MNDNLSAAKEILKKYNQEHLLYFYDELSEDEKDILINQILNINFEKIIRLYLNSKKVNKSSNIEISPLPHIEKDKLKNTELDYYTKIGEAVIKNNQVAVVTMAGGQGTRLRLQRSKRYIYAKSGAYKKIIISNYC